MVGRRRCGLVWWVGAVVLCMGGIAAWAGSSPRPARRDTTQIDLGDVKAEQSGLPADLTFRARVVSITPAKDVQIDWRYGGEELGGLVMRRIDVTTRTFACCARKKGRMKGEQPL